MHRFAVTYVLGLLAFGCGGSSPQKPAASPPAPAASAPAPAAASKQQKKAEPHRVASRRPLRDHETSAHERGQREARARAVELAGNGIIGVLQQGRAPNREAKVSVDSAEGGFGRKLAQSLLLGIEDRFDECVNRGAIEELAIAAVINVVDGKVTSGEVFSANDEVKRCVMRVLQRMSFPTSKTMTRISADIEIHERSGSGSAAIGLGGAGVGSGVGGIGAQSGKAPLVRVGHVNAAGALDKNIIRRFIRRKLPQVRFCYEKELIVQPKLKGIVRTVFVIGPSGKVSSANVQAGIHKTVDLCVAKVIRSIQFPKPKGGGRVRVSYPFSFEPAK
jgi:hypothetical protein